MESNLSKSSPKKREGGGGGGGGNTRNAQEVLLGLKKSFKKYQADKE